MRNVRSIDDNHPLSLYQRLANCWLKKCCKMFNSRESIGSNNIETYHIPPHDKIAEKYYTRNPYSLERLTTWMYTSSFPMVLLIFAFVYISLVSLFAFAMFELNILYEHHKRECMDGWDFHAANNVNFEMVFGLYWTTFSSKYLTV